MDRIFPARILEWLAIFFSRGSSQPRNWTQISHIAGRLLTLWATRESLKYTRCPIIVGLYSACWCISGPGCRLNVIFIYLFILLFLAAVDLCHCCGLSLVAASRGSFLLQSMSFSLWWFLLLWSTGSRHVGFSGCSPQAQKLWCRGLFPLRHVESSGTRNQTPCPLHWQTDSYPSHHQGSPWLSIIH